MDFISTKRKARKEHLCNWCHGTIKKNEVYDSQAIFEEGTVRKWKNHERCLELTKKLNLVDEGEGITQYDFQEAVEEFLYSKNQYDRMKPFSENVIIACVILDLEL